VELKETSVWAGLKPRPLEQQLVLLLRLQL
jgi:hypothetical protein